MIDWGSVYRGVGLAAVIVLFAVSLYFAVRTKRGQDALVDLFLQILDREVEQQTGNEKDAKGQ